MARRPLLLIAVLALFACEKRKGPGADMAEAKSWDQDPGSAAANPHGGDNPHAGTGMADPHGGMAMGGGGDNPHAGLGLDPQGNPVAHGGGDPEAAMAPDPAREIDPNKFVRGAIQLTGDTKDKVPARGAMFLFAKADDGAGNPVGPPLAVDVLPIGPFPMAFELNERHQMVKGTSFSGKVVLIARIDQDENVDSWEPGDLSGKLATQVGTGDVVLKLDTITP